MKEEDGETETFNCRMDKELLERMRNAVFELGKGLSLRRIVEEGARIVLERLEREHNNGKPFLQRSEELLKSRRRSKAKKPKNE